MRNNRWKRQNGNKASQKERIIYGLVIVLLIVLIVAIGLWANHYITF